MLQASIASKQMQAHLSFFEKSFLAPLEQASSAAILAASREQDAASMQW
jgi:hypothetical protein